MSSVAPLSMKCIFSSLPYPTDVIQLENHFSVLKQLEESSPHKEPHEKSNIIVTGYE